MSDHDWLELCEVSVSLIQELGAKPFDAVRLSRSEPITRPDAELSSFVLQVVPADRYGDDGSQTVVKIHPQLCEYLESVVAACHFSPSDVTESTEKQQGRGVTVSIEPLLIENHIFAGQDDLSFQLASYHWELEKVEVVDLPDDSKVHLTCLHTELPTLTLERRIPWALETRLVQAGTMIALPEASFLIVNNVVDSEVERMTCRKAFRIRPGSKFAVVMSSNKQSSNDYNEGFSGAEQERDCPGYEHMIEEMVSLSHMSEHIAPSGVLVTGGAGVGKTTLVACFAQCLAPATVHWVSVQDLILRASWASYSDLVDLLKPVSRNAGAVLVVDDLHLLSPIASGEPSRYDPELLLARNAILEVIDQPVSPHSRMFIVGIGHTDSQLPREFTKIGRLEKEMHMSAPTQLQREAILGSLLREMQDVAARQRCVSGLIPLTSGYVAADLRRLYTDAWTRAQCHERRELTWADLSEASRRIVPSELAQLDVLKAPVFPHSGSQPARWSDIHQWSWRRFGGYSEMKRRIYTTVVAPWRRYMARPHANKTGSDSAATGGYMYQIPPPRGVLFHGKSGTGKSFAADCLASSLGLHVVKVRASEILDAWLGGSEAAVRSLFGRARAASPCILFFDEVDAIASNRASDGTGSDVTSRILTTFLNEMDGISTGAENGVLVVACTNRMESVDAALLRPGRLDEHVNIPLPSFLDVIEILRVHLERVPLATDVDLESLSNTLVQNESTGAEVEGVCRDACSIAIRDAQGPLDAVVVSSCELDQAISRMQR